MKIANTFRKTSYESRLSKVVKLIRRWVTDVLKYEKRHLLKTSQIIIEICGISVSKNFNIEPAPAQNQ